MGKYSVSLQHKQKSKLPEGQPLPAQGSQKNTALPYVQMLPKWALLVRYCLTEATFHHSPDACCCCP